MVLFFVSYGIRLAIALTKLVIERGYKPFVVIRPENDASRNLYTKLGFTKAYETCRVKLTPYVPKTTTTNGSCGPYEPSAPEVDKDTTTGTEEVGANSEQEEIEDLLTLKCSLGDDDNDDEGGDDEQQVEVIPSTATPPPSEE